MSGKLDGRSYAGTLKNFQSTHIGYRAHRAVIFAIAWHLVYKGDAYPIFKLMLKLLIAVIVNRP